jgi:predicted signal transduction protein with EAL and GGDEF domain
MWSSTSVRAPAPPPVGDAPAPWLARLRRALAEDRFVVHYQPIVSLAGGEVAHYEALV